MAVGARSVGSPALHFVIGLDQANCEVVVGCELWQRVG